MKTKYITFRSTAIVLVLILILGNIGALAKSRITFFGGVTATIRGTNVNVRQSPDVNSKVLTQLQDGELLKVLERQEKSVVIGGKTDHWYKVSGKFGTGWVFGAFLDVHPDPEASAGKNLILDVATLCDGIENFYQCQQLLEDEWMRNYPEFAKRNKGKLFLKMDDGKWKSYEDINDPEGDRYLAHSLTAVFESPRAFLLSEQHYEGGAWTMIHRKDGSEFEVLGRPIFSKSNMKFACFSMDLEAGYDPTGIEIWSWNNGKCTREFELLDGTEGGDQRWGPTGIEWVTDNLIRVSRVTIRTEDYEYVPMDPISYEFAKGKWQAVR